MALHRWGIVVGGGVMALLAAFVLADGPGDAPGDAPPPPHAQAPKAAPQPAMTPEPVLQIIADTPTQSGAPVSFLVRFADTHALAEAQALAAAGEADDARRLAQRLIRRERALRGLCFERFTLGGAEIVLKPCDALPIGDADSFVRRWRERFETMPGVTYAESNVILRPDAARP